MITNEQVKKYSEILSKSIKKDKYEVEMILTITKWWLIPTYYIAKQLNISV